MDAADLHAAVEKAFNASDLDALVALYEPDARLLAEDGEAAEGLDAIREAWAGLTGLGGQISMTTRYSEEVGDLALLSNAWTFQMDGATQSGITAEVAHRDGDGVWHYVIDNPYAATR
jgi:ketosteroid isomerase-like protein